MKDLKVRRYFKGSKKECKNQTMLVLCKNKALEVGIDTTKSRPVSKKIVRDRFFTNSIAFARSVSIFCANDRATLTGL